MAIPVLQDAKLRLTDCIYFGDAIAEAAIGGSVPDGSITLVKLAAEVTAVALGGAAAIHTHDGLLSGLLTGYIPVGNDATSLVNGPLFSDGVSVGLGTDTPSDALHVRRSGSRSALFLDGQGAGGYAALKIECDANTSAFLVSAGNVDGDGGLPTGAGFSIRDTNANADRLVIFNNGQVDVPGTLTEGGTQVSLVGHGHAAGDITSGVLPVTRGGTNATSFGPERIVYAGSGGTTLVDSPGVFVRDLGGGTMSLASMQHSYYGGYSPRSPLQSTAYGPDANYDGAAWFSTYWPAAGTEQRVESYIALGHDSSNTDMVHLRASWLQAAGQGKPKLEWEEFDFTISVPVSGATQIDTLQVKWDGTTNALHGLNVFDGDIRLLGNTFVGNEAPSATPRSLLEITHKATSIAAGYGAAFRVNSGAEPDYGTPGANTNVAGQFFSNNASMTNASLWGLNVVVGQGGAPIPAPTPPAGGIHIVGAEIEVFNRSDAGNAELRPVDPYASPDQIRSNGIEVIGHSGSTYRNAGALVVWANDATGGKWWDTGLALSRCYSYGVRFHRIAGDSVEPFQSALLDASELATAIQPLILARSSGDVRYDIKNDADYSVYLNIDSGDAAAAETALLFSDRGSRKWLIGKDSSNHLQIGWNDGANAFSAISAYIDDEGTPTEVLIGFYGTAPTAKPTVAGSKSGNAALASLLTALATLGLITDTTT
jgi:hypothetical protein